MTRYVAKAVVGSGWRIWNRKMKRWWGAPFKEFPTALLAELNGLKRPEKLTELTRKATS
jgi:hypothetical protein